LSQVDQENREFVSILIINSINIVLLRTYRQYQITKNVLIFQKLNKKFDLSSYSKDSKDPCVFCYGGYRMNTTLLSVVRALFDFI